MHKIFGKYSLRSMKLKRNSTNTQSQTHTHTDTQESHLEHYAGNINFNLDIAGIWYYEYIISLCLRLQHTHLSRYAQVVLLLNWFIHILSTFWYSARCCRLKCTHTEIRDWYTCGREPKPKATTYCGKADPHDVQEFIASISSSTHPCS